MTLDIDIVDKQLKINSLFVKANSRILDQYSDTIPQNIDLELKKSLLKELWFKEYRATLVLDKTQSKIVFNKQTDMTMFLLMFS
jgi:hypothetical protein